MTEKEMLCNYVNARKEVDRLDELVSEAKKRKESAEQVLVEALSAKGALSTAKFEGIGRVSLTKPKLYASFLKENEDTVFKFVESEGEGSIIKPSIHHSSLSSFVSRRVEDGKTIPEFLNYFFKTSVKFEKGE